MERQHKCEICGELHNEETHGTPIVLLQPSLHTIDEFNTEAIEEMASLEPNNKAIQKLYKEYEALPEMTREQWGSENMANEDESMALQEICDDMMQALNHPYYFGDDTFTIYSK